MPAKSMNWKFVGVFCTLIPMHVVLLVVLLILQDGRLTVIAQEADAAARLLDQKELALKWIAGNATLNDADCGSLTSCRAECSRARCLPLSSESRQCVSVPDSGFYNICPSEVDRCQSTILVDYSRSYVTHPDWASTKSLQTEFARDVCLQRRLDSTFKTVSVPSNYSTVYFGSTSGAFRSFPGREGSDFECPSTYDPRRRPWYLNGISVARDVKILVDVAKSMDQLLPVEYNRPPGAKYMDVVKNMTLALLQTVSTGDNVEVFSFDATNATSLGGALAVIDPYDYFKPNPNLAALMTNVNALAASSDAGASDLNGAIRRAAHSFNQIRSLKIIIVLSNGLFVVNSTSFPSAALQNNEAKLMVYKLPTMDDGGDTFLQSTPFQKDICSVQGSFELLDALATTNPLYSMRRYFTYLAGIQLSVAGGNVTWTFPYTGNDYNPNLLVPTYPAFGRDGLLIGVAGADVDIYKLDTGLRGRLLEEISKRSKGIPSTSANISMTCYYQTSIGPANWSCPPLDSSGICPRTDFTSTVAERSCCGTCSQRHFRYRLSLNALSAGFGSIASVLAIIIIAGILCYYIYRISLRYFLPLRAVEVDLFDLILCESTVKYIKEKLNSMQDLLNKRQCLDLSSKLSTTIGNIREIISCCGASANLFKPALEKLSLDLEKAKLLVLQCGKEDWYRAAVFQIHNEIAFQEILMDVGLCYNAIYEQAKSLAHEEGNFPQDLRLSDVFMPALETDVRTDQAALRKTLEDLAPELKVSGRVHAKQCLARYLLERLNHPSHENTSDTCCTMLWTKGNVPTGVWGDPKLQLEVVSGVCFTKWMGIQCAKKVFSSDYPEQFFLKEASISAHLKHPGVVDFICCGNGELRGERFIAMELMEKNLFELIEPRSEHFSLRVVVDIMVQIARGMCYLHAQGIAHRDLKPQNVVVKTRESRDIPHLEDHFCVKLVDFGTSKTNVEVLEDDPISIKGVGTTLYRAPEVHPDAYQDGVGRANWFKADAFSFAMTCAHMLTLQKPFQGTNRNNFFQDLMNGIRPELPENCPQELTSLLEDCWATNYSLRPTFVKIWTRLEVLRFKILRGYPDFTSNPHGESDEFINTEISHYNVAGIWKSMDASNGVAIGNDAVNARLESRVEDIMIIPSPSQRDTMSHASVEMTQRF